MPPAVHDIGPSTSFRRRLFLIFGGFTLLITVTFTTIDLIEDIGVIKNHAAEKAQLLASQLASNARLPLFADDRPTLLRLAKEIADYPDVRTVMITNQRGQVLARGGKPLATATDAIHRQAEIVPLGSGQGAEQALGITAAATSQTLGSVWVVMDNEVQQQVINRQIASALGTALLFCLVFIYLGTLIVRWISSALTPLIDGLRTIQTGDFAVHIRASRYAELAVATAAVNELAVALQFRDDENRRLQQELLDAMKNEVREERRQLMAKLIQTNRMTSLGLLTSSMAHEINTPNGAIKLAGQQVARIWGDTVPILDRVAAEEGDFILGGAEYSIIRQEVGRGLEVIGRSAERINQVINDLRAYSVGEQSPLTEQVCLNQVLTDALAIIMAHGKQGNVSIERQLTPDLPRVTGNRYHLGQVFTNLLLNGIQAVPPERPGALVISTDFDPASSQVLVSVQDNGEGIAEQIRSHLLEPFFTTRLEAGGSGLGLYIAHFIVTNHHGTLDFASQPGAGTTVTVSIPAAAKAAPTP